MATEITYWLVRHTPTGNYLPQPHGRMGRGGSWVEPVAHDPSNFETEPRVMTSKRSATGVLTQWLRGRVHHSSGTHEDHYSGGFEYYEDNEYELVPTRIKADMEIVSVNLVIP